MSIDYEISFAHPLFLLRRFHHSYVTGIICNNIYVKDEQASHYCIEIFLLSCSLSKALSCRTFELLEFGSVGPLMEGGGEGSVGGRVI